jgi:hypothetical protein
MTHASELQMSILLRNFLFWLTEVPNSLTLNNLIIWELIQLIEKFTYNQKFVQMIRNHKLLKVLLELSKDAGASIEVKKLCISIVKTLSGVRGTGGIKIKQEYIPSLLGWSGINEYAIEEILGLLSTGTPDEQVSALEQLAGKNFEGIEEGTVRFDYYQKLTNIFTLRSLKSKKHIIYFNQAVSVLTNNTTKDQCIEITQKDIFRKIHSFMLEAPAETHPVCIEYLSKLCKTSASAGMFNMEASMEFLKSPYHEFQKMMVMGTSIMSEKLGNVSSVRFIPGIKDYITLCLKSNDDKVIVDLLKTISNLSLD